MICVRGQCADSGLGRQLEKHLLHLIEQHGLDDANHPDHVSCRVTNCLAVCANGPVMIIHPEAIKYQHVDKAALEQIFESHILKGQPVEALMVKYPTSRPILKKSNGPEHQSWFYKKRRKTA